MNDNQLDAIKEIESISSLMQCISEQTVIEGDHIQRLGDILLKLCIKILEEEKTKCL